MAAFALAGCRSRAATCGNCDERLRWVPGGHHHQARRGVPRMKIIDLKCAVLGGSPVVRITTDAGISGFAQVETYKPYLKPHVLHLREALLGQDPTNVERVMQRIRQRGAFKPWGTAVSPELAAKEMLHELRPEDVGHKTADFWPGAMKSVTWDGKVHGVPTNNETMTLIWNAQIFRDAGLDPEQPPATWDDLVSYARKIKQKTGKAGYGLVARANAGNTPYRFMPHAWACGGGALDEAEDHPQYKSITINNEGTKAALQACYDMYVRDESTPRSALTNTQTENQDPFIAGQLGMMSSHPSEYAVMLDKAKRATGEDRKIADAVVANMRYGLIPKGPVRRAVVFGGWNFHIFNPNIVGGGLDLDAAMALAAFMTGPEWSVKLAWTGSNPGNRRGFRTSG